MRATTVAERTLTRIMRGSSAALLDDILRVLLPEARTICDLTWGSGCFWTPEMLARWQVVGNDINPSKATEHHEDFTALPFESNSYDVAIFDPPYHTDSGKDGMVQARFGSYPTTTVLRSAVQAGAREAYRVARVGCVFKVMDYIHASRLVQMSRWIEDELGTPYDVVYLESQSKLEDPKWSRRGGQLSVRSNCTTWLVYRADGIVHRRRKVRENGPDAAVNL